MLIRLNIIKRLKGLIVEESIDSLNIKISIEVFGLTMRFGPGLRHFLVWRE